jgi:predicted dehydrogenase
LATYRAAIIGLSWIATDPPAPAEDPVLGTAIPFSHAAALANIDNVEVVAGCDTVPGPREKFLDRWRGRWPRTRVYENYAELLERERPDIVTIATPDFLHADPFLKAVETGAKGIFIEKPFATRLMDATRMVEAARARNVVVNVDCTRRWMPYHVASRAFVDQGRLGKLSQIMVEIGGERAMLWRNHAHAVDLMCYFADADPSWVFGELEAGYEQYGTEYKGDGGRTIELEPGANYYVAFRNGVRGVLIGMKDTMPGIIVTLRCADGRLVLDDHGAHATFVHLIGHGAQADWSPPRTEPIVPKWTVAGMEAGIRDVINGIETGQPTAGPAEHGWRSVAIVDAVVRSQADGNRPARIDAPPWANAADARA